MPLLKKHTNSRGKKKQRPAKQKATKSRQESVISLKLYDLAHAIKQTTTANATCTVHQIIRIYYIILPILPHPIITHMLQAVQIGCSEENPRPRRRSTWNANILLYL